MNRIPVVALVAIAAVLIALALRSQHKTPLEIARLSESLLIAKVHAYHRNPTETNFQAAAEAITQHRKVVDRANLLPAQRTFMDLTLDEQIWLVRGIARNAHLKL